MLIKYVGWAATAFLVLAWFASWYRWQWKDRTRRTLDTAVRLPPAPQVCTWDGCQGTVALMGGQWRCSYSQAHKVPVQAEASQPCTASGVNCTCGHTHL